MIGTLVKNIRIKNNISQKDISEITKIDRGNISKIENNKRIPNLKHFVSLCEALQVTYDELKELHLAYEELIKPQQAEKLICEEFAKSEYIISLLLEGMHFKDEFIGLYKQAYDGNKYVLYQHFITRIIHFEKVAGEKFSNFTSTYFYDAIESFKNYSEGLIEFKILDVDTDKVKLLQQIKQYINEIRQLFYEKYNNNKPTPSKSENVKDYLNESIQLGNIQKEMIDKFIRVKNLNKIFTSEKKIKNIRKLFYHLIGNKKLISDDNKLIYDVETTTDFILTNLHPNTDIILDIITINKDYISYGFFLSKILFDEEKILIETDNELKIAAFKEKYDRYNLNDIIYEGSDPIDTRLKILSNEFKHVFQLILDILPIPDDKDSKIKYIEDILKKSSVLKNNLSFLKQEINTISELESINKDFESENKKLTKRNLELEQEIARLKQQLEDMKKEKE